MTDMVDITRLREAHEAQAKKAEQLRAELAEVDTESRRLREALETIDKYSGRSAEEAPRPRPGIQATVHALLVEAGAGGMTRKAIIQKMGQRFDAPIAPKVVGNAIAQLRLKGKVRNGDRGHWFAVQGELHAAADELKM